jgi:hypothetical protein
VVSDHQNKQVHVYLSHRSSQEVRHLYNIEAAHAEDHHVHWNTRSLYKIELRVTREEIGNQGSDPQAGSRRSRKLTSYARRVKLLMSMPSRKT